MDFVKEDRIIVDFLRSLGPWSSSIVIGGGYALIIYKTYFSDPNRGYPPAGTRDIDSLIPRKIRDPSTRNIRDYLLKSGFQHQFKDLQDPATEFYKKMIEDEDVIIEFLTDDAVRENKEKNVTIAGIVAQSLSYLKLSIENTLPFATFSGEKGFVVTPEAWIFHKGLTFPKRVEKKKVYKDLYGIWYAASQLNDFSEKSITRLKNLFIQHPAWAKTFKKNLSNWHTSAIPLDWTLLESQDQFGKLTKMDFLFMLEKLLS